MGREKNKGLLLNTKPEDLVTVLLQNGHFQGVRDRGQVYIPEATVTTDREQFQRHSDIQGFLNVTDRWNACKKYCIVKTSQQK